MAKNITCRDSTSGADKSDNAMILRAVLKLEDDPLSYGELLGEKMGIDLSGMRKLKPARGYRLVYQVEKDAVVTIIIAVGKRNELQAYREAAKRIAAYRKNRP